MFPCSLKVFLRYWCSLFPKICFCSRVPSFIFLMFPCSLKVNDHVPLLPKTSGRLSACCAAFDACCRDSTDVNWCKRSGLRHKRRTNHRGRLGIRLNDAFLLVHFNFVAGTVCKSSAHFFKCCIGYKKKTGLFCPRNMLNEFKQAATCMQHVVRTNFCPHNIIFDKNREVKKTAAGTCPLVCADLK